MFRITHRAKCNGRFAEYLRTSLIALIVNFFFSSTLTHLAIAETIQLVNQDGEYLVSVQINRAILLPFVLDTGATNVVIPADVFLTLMRTGTVKNSDYVGTGTATLADGSEHPREQYLLRELRVGDHVVRNVVASVSPVKGEPLLGQSFLSKLPAWTIDNERHALILKDKPGPGSVDVTTADPQAEMQADQRYQQALQKFARSLARSGYTPDDRGRNYSTSPGDTSLLPIAELEHRGRNAVDAKNYTEAMRWYRLAAERGSAVAENDVGVLYAEGLGVPRNYSEAMRWYRLATDQGLAKAQHNVGNLYSNGWGVPQNKAEAAHWYRMAADQGLALSQSTIAGMYVNGSGVPRDYAEAMRWYRLAADQGLAEAQYYIGYLYAKGWGVAQDYVEAMRWFRVAADKGNAVAQNGIGFLAARGEGVSKDCRVAKQWLDRAAGAGNETARNNLRSGVDGACRW